MGLTTIGSNLDDSGIANAGSPDPRLVAEAGRFLRDGEPHRILSGSLHYFRVHPEQWRDRLLRLRDMGLNTIDTYVPWNFHRPSESRPADFTGWRDLTRFLQEAQSVGLDVILRPGPYICAEWTNGGLPAWLTARRPALRSADPAFTGPVEEWFRDLLPRLVPFQAVFGGPVVAFQVENEFGSFGDDGDYLRWLDALLVDLGVVELRYTADGPTELMQDGGAVPGVLASATLGSKPGAARRLLAGRRTGEPFFVAEFWNGWFDHWGHAHHVRDAEEAGRTLAEIVADEGNVSVYMAHGGTNFGLWAGANDVDGELRPTTTSYDSDAPIAEDGTLTAKFGAARRALGALDRPVTSAQPRFLAPRTLALRPGAALEDALRALETGPAVDHAAPRSFEQLGTDTGLVVYDADALLPRGEVVLRFTDVADRALVLVDGHELGVVTGSGEFPLVGRGERVAIRVVVENLGRINYGPRLGEHKGLLGPVQVDRRIVQGWRSTPVDLQTSDAAQLSALARRTDPLTAGASHAIFELDEPHDTHLALPGFEKAFVWVNGFLLGRHWSIGPQETLYLPAPLLRAGRNQIDVLELHGSGTALELRDRAALGPTEQYIEEF